MSDVSDAKKEQSEFVGWLGWVLPDPLLTWVSNQPPTLCVVSELGLLFSFEKEKESL